MHKKFLIIGAGPCGLGAAWRLKELGCDDFLILEASDSYGGLARSIKDENGFTWDLGGHVLHSHYPYFDQFFEKVMEGNYCCVKRSAWIYLFKRYVPYPFQYNIHFLPKKIFKECLNSIINNPVIKKLTSYEDWILREFGVGIAKYFMIPYTTKVWTFPPKELGFFWVSDRVAQTDKNRLLASINNSSQDSSWGPNYWFNYPTVGGNGDLWQRTGELFKKYIRLNSEIVSIDAVEKTVQLKTGKTFEYETLISTAPSDTIQTLIRGVPVPTTKKTLKYSSVCLIGLGMKGAPPPVLKDKLWMYYPEKEFPFFRATVLSNFVPSVAPNGTWSLMCEMSYRDTSPDINLLIKETITSMKELGYIKHQDEIVDVWSMNIPKGYPVPTLDRDEVIDTLVPPLEEYGIYFRGRFGLWKYEISNQDHTFMQGVELIDRLQLGKPEQTIRDADFVNNRKK